MMQRLPRPATWSIATQALPTTALVEALSTERVDALAAHFGVPPTGRSKAHVLEDIKASESQEAVSVQVPMSGYVLVAEGTGSFYVGGMLRVWVWMEK
jgi:hypothetical protein